MSKRNHEVVNQQRLLNARGNISEPGWARRQLWQYSRKDITAAKWRIKEWDYYLVNNGRFALALTVADNGYMGMDSVSLLDFEEGWVHLRKSNTEPIIRIYSEGKTEAEAERFANMILEEAKKMV